MPLTPPKSAAELEGWIAKLSVRQLKEYIQSRELSHADCVEASELRARAKEAALKHLDDAHVAESAGPGADTHRLKERKQKIGPYNTLLVSPGDKCDAVVVVLHGYGASHNDFLPFAEALMQMPQLRGKRVMFAFPQANGMPPEWWELDVLSFASKLYGGEAALARLIREEPPGLQKARGHLREWLRDVRALAGSVAADKVVLAGFSQGAMTAADLALSLPKDEHVGGLCIFSGAPIVVEQWAERAAEQLGLRVLITHGKRDTVLPFVASTWTRDLFVKCGLDVQYETHNGGHELGPHDVLVKIGDFIAKCLA